MAVAVDTDVALSEDKTFVIIRPEQLKALARPVEENLEERLSRFVQERVPGLDSMSEPELRRAVGEQIDKARGYGMETESDLALYVATAAMLGPNFDVEFPAATEILNSPVLPASMKTDWLVEWTEAIFKALECPQELE